MKNYVSAIKPKQTRINKFFGEEQKIWQPYCGVLCCLFYVIFNHWLIAYLSIRKLLPPFCVSLFGWYNISSVFWYLTWRVPYHEVGLFYIVKWEEEITFFYWSNSFFQSFTYFFKYDKNVYAICLCLLVCANHGFFYFSKNDFFFFC